MKPIEASSNPEIWTSPVRPAKEDVGTADVVDRRGRFALEAQRRNREPERLDKAFEAVVHQERPDRRQSSAQAGCFLRRVFEHLSLIEGAHDQTSRAGGRGERGERLGLAGAFVVPDVERVEGVDAEDLNPGIGCLGADPAGGLNVFKAVVTDIVTQLDRDSAKFSGGIDQLDWG